MHKITMFDKTRKDAFLNYLNSDANMPKEVLNHLDLMYQREICIVTNNSVLIDICNYIIDLERLLEEYDKLIHSCGDAKTSVSSLMIKCILSEKKAKDIKFSSIENTNPTCNKYNLKDFKSTDIFLLSEVIDYQNIEDEKLFVRGKTEKDNTLKVAKLEKFNASNKNLQEISDLFEQDCPNFKFEYV